jgi:capsular polysaccharide biosynthesis protein
MVHCQELLVPTQLRNHPEMIKGINWLRNKVSGLMVEEAEANEYLYLSRRDTELRNLVNDDDLEQALIPLGFKVVLPGSMSVADQIRAFSSARVIVAQHGAGMANILFAPTHAMIIEISSTNIYRMEDFRIIADNLGQQMRTLVSADYIDNSIYPDDHRNREFSIDIDDVLEVLQEYCPELFQK